MLFSNVSHHALYFLTDDEQLHLTKKYTLVKPKRQPIDVYGIIKASSLDTLYIKNVVWEVYLKT